MDATTLVMTTASLIAVGRIAGLLGATTTGVIVSVIVAAVAYPALVYALPDAAIVDNVIASVTAALTAMGIYTVAARVARK